MKKLITYSIVTLSFVFLISHITIDAQSQKGGERLKQLISKEAPVLVDQLETGDLFAMGCSKCKTIWVNEVRRDAKGAELLKAKGAPTKLLGKHLCKGCGSHVVITGHGKGKKVELKHTCQACGDHSPFCCVNKKISESKK